MYVWFTLVSHGDELEIPNIKLHKILLLLLLVCPNIPCPPPHRGLKNQGEFLNFSVLSI